MRRLIAIMTGAVFALGATIAVAGSSSELDAAHGVRAGGAQHPHAGLVRAPPAPAVGGTFVRHLSCSYSPAKGCGSDRRRVRLSSRSGEADPRAPFRS